MYVKLDSLHFIEEGEEEEKRRRRRRNWKRRKKKKRKKEREKRAKREREREREKRREKIVTFSTVVSVVRDRFLQLLAQHQAGSDMPDGAAIANVARQSAGLH